VQRREEYIKLLHQQLGEQHPLVLLVKQCLNDAPSERPTAQELLQRLEDMKALIEDPYEHLTKLEAMRMLAEKDAALKEKDTALKEKDAALKEKDTALKDAGIGDLHTQVQVSYRSTSDQELYSSVYFVK
jgi:DNA repair protein RadC